MGTPVCIDEECEAAPEQWFEVTRWINDSGAAVAAGKPLCIHQTCNHSFLYCFKLLNIISNTSHDDQQAHWNVTGISKCVDFSRQSNEETAIMLEPDIPVGLSKSWEGTPCHLPACPFPCLTAGSMGTSHLSGQDKSCQSAQNYPFSTQHDIIMPVILYGCISSDRWQQNYEGIKSNGLIPAGSVSPCLQTDTMEAAWGASHCDSDAVQARPQECCVFQFPLVGLFQHTQFSLLKMLLMNK